MQYVVRLTCGLGPVHCSTGLSEARSDLCVSRIRLCSMVSDLLLGQASLTFRSDTCIADLFQAKPDLLVAKIRLCNLGHALRLCKVSCTFRTGTQRSDLVQCRPDLCSSK